MNISTVELIGYLGSILVAISLMMKSLLRLRIINLFGALFFTIYGVLLSAYPVAFLNGMIVCIDLYYLFQMWRQKDFFTFLEVSPEGKYLNAFLEFYRDDILEIIPTYRSTTGNDVLCFFILRDMMPAGLFIARVRDEEAQIHLDYVTPNYRDFKVGRFIFEENAAFFRERGIRRFISDGGSPIHRKYLEKMGFVPRENMYVHEIGEKVVQDNRL